VTLGTDYAKAMEQARQQAKEGRQELEIAENHLLQLSKFVTMRRRHLRETEASLAEMEALYERWQKMTPNAELRGRPLADGPA
jgi:hypothetical protein